MLSTFQLFYYENSIVVEVLKTLSKPKISQCRPTLQ